MASQRVARFKLPKIAPAPGCALSKVSVVARAVEHNAPIESVFLDPSVLSNLFGRKLARRLRKRGVLGIRLSHQLYLNLTLATQPQGIGAILQQKWTSLDEVRARPNSLWLAVESMESTGNLGTIIRTAEAAGATGIFILGTDCDPYDPGAVRASMGSLFSQRLVRCSQHEFIDWATSNRVATVASSPAGLMEYKTIRYRFPAVLVIGSEKSGVSDQLLETVDFVVRIPMHGECDSINAADAKRSPSV